MEITSLSTYQSQSLGLSNEPKSKEPQQPSDPDTIEISPEALRLNQSSQLSDPITSQKIDNHTPWP